jgi:hypothetical protein
MPQNFGSDVENSRLIPVPPSTIFFRLFEFWPSTVTGMSITTRELRRVDEERLSLSPVLRLLFAAMLPNCPSAFIIVPACNVYNSLF